MTYFDWYEEDEPTMDEIVEICKRVRKERAQKRCDHAVFDGNAQDGMRLYGCPECGGIGVKL
jgi:predicted RNA-binding Zn-ribbon protein involved in translation (DUF1610 family)